VTEDGLRVYNIQLLIFLFVTSKSKETLWLCVLALMSLVYFSGDLGHSAKNDRSTEVLRGFCTRETFLWGVPGNLLIVRLCNYRVFCLSTPIRFYYRIRELNFPHPGLPQQGFSHARARAVVQTRVLKFQVGRRAAGKCDSSENSRFCAP
jgi:hypothetical protein